MMVQTTDTFPFGQPMHHLLFNLPFNPAHPFVSFLPPPPPSSSSSCPATSTSASSTTTSCSSQSKGTVTLASSMRSLKRSAPQPQTEDVIDPITRLSTGTTTIIAPARKVTRPTELWNPSEPSTHITALFPEVLSILFSFLDTEGKGRAAQVCRSWRDAAYNKSVWRGVQAKLHLKKNNPTLFSSLVRRGISKIQVLSLSKHLKELTLNVPHMDRLVLSGCYNLTDDKITPAFGSELIHLQELDLSMCKKVTDCSVIRITNYVPNLRSLDLGGCATISNASLGWIQSNLCHLDILNLRSCRNITDSGIGQLCGIFPRGHSRYEQEGESSQDANPPRGQQLKHIVLQDCQKLTDDALNLIGTGLPDLQSINLSFCASFTEFGLKSLSNMTHLKDINLRSCDNVSDIGLRYLAEGSISLHHLDISFCDKITDQGLAFIAQGLTRLKTLSLNSCSVTDDGIIKLSESLNDLEVLNVGQCSRITDKGVTKIIEKCPKLNKLDIYGCSQITPALVNKLMLQKLKLTREIWPDLELPSGSGVKSPGIMHPMQCVNHTPHAWVGHPMQHGSVPAVGGAVAAAAASVPVFQPFNLFQVSHSMLFDSAKLTPSLTGPDAHMFFIPFGPMHPAHHSHAAQQLIVQHHRQMQQHHMQQQQQHQMQRVYGHHHPALLDLSLR